MKTEMLGAMLWVGVLVIGTGCRPHSQETALPAGGSERTLAVAAASDLQFALQEIADAYTRRHAGIQIAVTYGSSGNLFAQLQQKAPFDLFLAADIDYPARLAAAGHGHEDVFPYAVGHLVVWTTKTGDWQGENVAAQVLTDPRNQKIAVANPRTAPYGRAAVEALKSMGVMAAVEEKLVYGDNVAQAGQFVRSGGADAGVVALSLAMAPDMQATGKFWPVPAGSHPPLVQGGLIMKQTRLPIEAKRLRDFICGSDGRAILDRFGFASPEHATEPVLKYDPPR